MQFQAKRAFIAQAVFIIAVMLGGCAYQGSDDPISRRFTWFSYLNGDDIRAACAAGANDRYRFVYNAIYVEQVRTYDFIAGGEGNDHLLLVRVIGPSDLSQVLVEKGADLMTPWRGKDETVRLRDEDMGMLKRAMQAGGVFAGGSGGYELSSDSFYWLVGACRDGRFHFNAYLWPSDRFDKTVFPKLLLAWDPTGVPLNEPRPASFFEIHGERKNRNVISFNVRVGDNGLWGVEPLF